MNWKESEGKGFDIEPDIYDAICTGMIDIGTQHGEWQGKEKIQRQCIIQWELLDSMYEKEDGTQHRMHFSQFYTQSLDHRAKLRKHLKGWRGRDFNADELKGFDPKNILGKPCRLTIGTSDSGKTVVDSILKYKGEPAEPDGDLHYFTFTEADESGKEKVVFTGEFPEWMSDGIRGLCEKSDEYQAYSRGDTPSEPEIMPAPEDDDSDVPF